jgi:glycine/D-amino acid oxidase-like deaminating enzyme
MAKIPLDMQVIERAAATIVDQVPAIATAATAEHRGGLFTMTADGRFLAGPAPGLAGLWVATGCNGSGFSFSSSIGRVLAEWITTGEPSLDIRSLDPARFVHAPLADAALTKAAIWQYANYYTPTGVTG